MARSIRKTVVLAKLEATSGTDSAPSNTADAVLFHASGQTFQIEQQFAERDVVTGVFASPDQLPYTRRGTVGFTIDGAGAGAAGTAAPWSMLAQVCGMAETLSAGVSATYNTVSTGLKTLTAWAYKDGELLKFKYCAGNLAGDFTVGQVPKLTFSLQGLVTSVTAASNPAPTLTAWKRPVAVGPAFTSKLKLGGTLTTGVLGGGTDFSFKSLQFDLGNDVQFDELATDETVAIYGRNSTLTCVVDLTVAAEVSKYAEMAAGTPTSIGFNHGTVAGNILTMFFANAVLTGVSDNVDGNKLLSSLTFTLTDATANDAVQIVVK